MKQIVLYVLTKKRVWIGIFAFTATIVGHFSQEAGQEVKETSKVVIDAVFDESDDQRGAGER